MKIKPNDDLFLGSGKRFIKGESTWLGTRLIPYPSVFYGSICSLMLSLDKSRNNEYIKNKNDKSDPRRYLKTGNIYIYNEKDHHIYIPAPLDIFVDKDNKDQCYISKLEKVNKNIVCSVDMCSLFISPKNAERVDGMFISLNTFYNSYYYNNDEVDIICHDDVVSNSYKVGIQRNRKYTAKDEHLYRIDLTEFKDDKNNRWSYLLEYEIKNDWWEDTKNNLGSGYLKLGGENKVCKYYSRDMSIINNYSDIQDEVEYNYVKLILMTPLIKKTDNWKLNIDDIDVIAASTGKPYDIGGFDLKHKIPKPMYKAVPQGSIYILDVSRLEKRTIKDIKDHIKKLDTFFSQRYGFGQFRIVPFFDE